MTNTDAAQRDSIGTSPRDFGKVYSALGKGLHWLIAVLVLFQFVISTLMPDIGPKTVPGTLINLHLSFGVVILSVMTIRFVHGYISV